MRSSTVIVADLGSSHFAWAAFERRSARKLVLRQMNLEQFGLETRTENEWIQQIAAAAGRIPPSVKGDLRVSLPGNLALTKFIKTPLVKRAKLARVVQFEAAQNIPFPLHEVVWDHEVVSTSRSDLELLLSAAKLDPIEKVCAAIQSAGRRIAHLSPGIYTLRDSFRYNYPECSGSVLVVDIGSRTTHLVWLHLEDYSGRTVTWGGDQLTQAVADDLGVDFATAEPLKRDYTGVSAEGAGENRGRIAIEKAAEAFSAKLVAEINRSIAGLARQPGFVGPSQIYLTGGGSLLAGLAGSLSNRVKLPVESFGALRAVRLLSDAAVIAGGGGVMALAQMVGLAVPTVPDSARLNLLPPNLRDAVHAKRREPALVAAAVLCAAAWIPPILHFQRTAASTIGRQRDLETQLQPLRTLKHDTELLRQELAIQDDQIAKLAAVVDRKTSWLRFLADLQQRMTEVEDVWLESLSIVRDSIDAPASTGSADSNRAMRLALSGRLLDRNHPTSRVSADSVERVKKLISSIGASRFVSAVEQQRFDNTQPGILQFDFLLVLQTTSPL